MVAANATPGIVYQDLRIRVLGFGVWSWRLGSGVWGFGGLLLELEIRVWGLGVCCEV